MWVADDDEDSLYAYRLSDGNPLESKGFDLDSSNDDPEGIWSDGYTIWVADATDDKLYAYALQGGQRQAGRDFNTLSGAGNTTVADITSDGRTMWAVDFDGRKVYSYNMPPSANANLSSLTLSPRDIIGFAPDRTSYQRGVAGSVGTATITAAADHPAATIGYSATDADLGTPGHQVNLLAGRNAVTVTVTAEDGTTRAYTVTINRGVNSQYGWKAGDDLDGLIAAGNRGPRGIWANSTTFYISDFNGDKVYAYNRDGTRDDTKDFDTSGSTFPNGIWSDGTTLWVADSASTTLFAYTLSNGNRNTGAEITLLNGARGVWGNSTTIWAVNDTTDKLEAYQRSDGTDDNDKDITLHADNGDPAGIWSDDTTVWVADHGEDRLFAYTLSGGARDMTKEIDTSTSGNENPRGLWGEGDTIWVTDEDDDRVYSYNLQDNRSSDATLSALTTSPRNILRFDADRTAYEVGVASTVAQATVTATANDANARVSYSGTDADLVAVGHQVALSAGRNQVTVTVTAENDSTKTYRVRINRGVDTPYGWKAEHDLDGLVLATALDRPQGITGDGGIFWVSSVFSRDLLAYRQDGQRVPSRDFTAHIDNQSSNYLWNDGETIWVPHQDDDKLYAYRLSDGARQTDREFDLHTNNTAPTGIWSDGITVWVADSADTKLYAYALDGGARQESKEFDLDSSNQLPGGIWSDGLTIWVADESTDRLHAYDLANGSPQPTRDFTTLSAAQNRDPVDIWSDGTTMWVVDYDDDKAYSYNMPLSNDATLSALTVSPKDIIGFDADRTSYQVGVASTVAQATVTATANHEAARVDFTHGDANGVTPGHQVNLSAGRNAVTVTVTAEDDSTREYRVSINRGVTDTYGWNADRDLDGLIAAENQSAYGIWGNDTTFWVSDDTDDKLYAYNADGSRDASQDFDTLIAVDNRNPRGIWSNGTTMWVADNFARKIFAYRMSDKQPDSTKDFNTLNAAGNINPQGIWSNGTTMWVSDLNTRRIYAYRMSDQQRDGTKDFNSLAAANGDPVGISSDGTTMWVGDPGAGKLYAYDMATKAHVDTRDFNTLSGAENGNLTDIWTDGETMWVVDYDDEKVYSYNMGLPPPANLQPATGDRRITITWDNPQESAITGYQYRVSNDDGASWNPDWTTIPGSNARTTSHTVRGLTNNVEHIIELRVLEDANPSGAARFRATPLGPPSAPLMPENLDTVAGDQTLYLSWHKPVEDPRVPVISFDARYRPYGSSGRWRNATSVSVEQTPRILYNQTIEGLDNRRPYELQVAAVNRVGRGPWATATDVPQAAFRYEPPSDDGDEALDLGPLHASWTDRLNSVTFHPDQKRLNINIIENSCMAPATFRIFWDVQDKAAKEYEADIQTREGTGEVTHQFGTETFMENNTRYEQGYIYGTAQLHKSSTLSVRVRARFKPEGWSTWSEPVNLHCFETENPATSQQLAEGDNSPATGRPAIAGTARVGETLSATTSGIADPDGLTSATFSYQWARDDGSASTDITDATASTYTLQEEDLDLQVSVTVSFTDDAGNDETLTSAAVHVQPPTPLSGAFDSATLPSEHDGSNTFTFELHFSEEPDLGYEAVRDHVLDVTNGDVTSVRRTTPGSNLRWEITVQPDGNDEVTLLLPITANCGDEGAVCTGSEKKLLIGAVVFVRGPATSQEQTAANTPATGNPAVTGTARVGQTLTADTSGIADADGLHNATFSHQWVSSDGVTDTDIPGETGPTYVVRPGDAGKMIKLRVSFTDDADNDETTTSAATAAVSATVPGTPRSLQVQTAGTGELAVTWQTPESNGGSNVTGYQVQWKLESGSWNTEADVSSATTTGISYTITSLSLNTEYAVRVIAVNGVGDGPPTAEQTETARAQASSQQGSASNTAATGQPTISGTAQVGETLTAGTGGISDENGLEDASFSYQWLRNDGDSDTRISGATGATYTVHNDDADQSLKVQVSFTDDDGFKESLTSGAAAVPVPTPLTAAFDEKTLPDSHNGSTPFTLELFFNIEPSLDADAVTDHVLTITGGEVTEAEQTTTDSNLRWRITVQPDGTDDVTITLPETTDCAEDEAVCTQHGQMLSEEISETIAGPEPPPAPTGLTGTLNDDGTITLTWDTPEDDSATSYQILRRRPQWQEIDLEVHVDDTGNTQTTYTDTSTAESTRYVYRIKARNAAGLSEWSNFVRIDKMQ